MNFLGTRKKVIYILMKSKKKKENVSNPDFEYHYVLALRLMSSRKYDDARHFFLEALEMDISNNDRGKALFNLAETEMLLGDDLKAVEIFKQSLYYMPGNIFAYRHLKSIFLRNNKKLDYFLIGLKYIMQIFIVWRFVYHIYNRQPYLDA
jgi:tetratricopeptide (TPR) repeat protein